MPGQDGFVGREHPGDFGLLVGVGGQWWGQRAAAWDPAPWAPVLMAVWAGPRVLPVGREWREVVLAGPAGVREGTGGTSGDKVSVGGGEVVPQPGRAPPTAAPPRPAVQVGEHGGTSGTGSFAGGGRNGSSSSTEAAGGSTGWRWRR